MFERLIDALTLNYTFMAKSRDAMTKDERDQIAGVGRTWIKHAPRALVPEGAEITKHDQLDLQECELIQDHVQQMAEWIEQLRINEIMG